MKKTMQESRRLSQRGPVECQRMCLEEELLVVAVHCLEVRLRRTDLLILWHQAATLLRGSCMVFPIEVGSTSRQPHSRLGQHIPMKKK